MHNIVRRMPPPQRIATTARALRLTTKLLFLSYSVLGVEGGPNTASASTPSAAIVAQTLTALN